MQRMRRSRMDINPVGERGCFSRRGRRNKQAMPRISEERDIRRDSGAPRAGSGVSAYRRALHEANRDRHIRMPSYLSVLRRICC